MTTPINSAATYTKDEVLNLINSSFNFTAPDQNALGLIEENAQKFRTFANDIVSRIPDPTCQYNFVIGLVQSMMWANVTVLSGAGSATQFGAARKAG